MKHVPSDKFNIAWFKLAECISRGEKERALGIYRLLAHSFEDTAFAHQLEGDILRAFGDEENAITCYNQAAKCYFHDKRLWESAAVYEHLLVLMSSKKEVLTQLITVYTLLNIDTKIAAHLETYFLLFLGKKELKVAGDTLKKLEQYLSLSRQIDMREKFIYVALQSETLSDDDVKEHLHIFVRDLIDQSQQKRLNKFLSFLRETSERLYEEVQQYLSEDTTVS